MSATLRGRCRRLVRRYRPVNGALLLLALVLGCASTLQAQLVLASGSTDLGSATIGGGSTTTTFQFTVPSGGAKVVSVNALSQGLNQEDFLISSQNCVGNLAGPASCAVTVTFSPVAVGLRTGALQTFVQGVGLTTYYLHGIGTGAQLVFSPDSATATTTVTPLQPIYYSPSAAVSDGLGNIYFNDYLNSRVLEQSANGTISVVASVAGAKTSSLALNGAGIVYVSVPQQSAVYTLAGGAITGALPFTGVTISTPTGLAIGPDGTLYVAESTNNRIIRSNPDGSNATVLVLTGLTKGLSGPTGLAIDSAGNLYIADTGNARIVKVVLSTLVATPVTLTGALLFNPSGVAVDASGTLFIADTGNKRIVRVSTTGTATAVLTPNFSFSAPTAVTISPLGDLIIADNNSGLTRILRSIPSTTLTFSTPTPMASLDSSDGAKSITLQNGGNAPVQLTLPAGSATNPTVTNSAFALTSTGTCPQLSSATTGAAAQIAPGISCTYAVNFTPTAVGANTGSLNVMISTTGSAFVSTQSIPLAGTGLPVVDSFAVTAPTKATLGTPVAFTVTAVSGGNTSYGFTGTVTLTSTDAKAAFLNGTTYTFTAADAGVHTFAAPAGVRFGTVGTFTVTATSGTSSGTSNGIVVGPAAATSDAITLTINPTATLGVADPYTVDVLLNGALATGYRDMVTVTTTDPLATIVNGATYTFTAADAGEHSFPGGIIFRTAGVIAVTVTDGVHTFTANVTVAAGPGTTVPTIVLGGTPNPVIVGNTATLTATVSSAAGTPTGTVSFLQNGAVIATVALVNGVATDPVTLTTAGSSVITARYSGSATFATVTSAPFTLTGADFNLNLASSGSNAATVLPGGVASYTFTVNPVGSANFPGTIVFTATGLPGGATAVFSPATFATLSATANTTLTITAPALKATSTPPTPPHSTPAERISPIAFALLFLPLLSRRRRKLLLPLLAVFGVLAAGTFGLTGCLSDQASGYFGNTPQTYTITVTATSGALSRSTTVTLTVQ